MTFSFINGTFPVVLQWVLRNSYPFILIALVIEGPVVASAAAFAASLGYLDLTVVFILTLLGDIIGDLIWYGLGYFGRTAFINKFGHRFGLSHQRMAALRVFFERHPIKTLVVIKVSPFLPVPGLIMVGSSHMSIKKFVSVISIIILPKTIFFVGLGYLFGNAYDVISGYISSGVYALVIIVVLILTTNYGFKAVSAKLSEKLEEDLKTNN